MESTFEMAGVKRDGITVFLRSLFISASIAGIVTAALSLRSEQFAGQIAYTGIRSFATEVTEGIALNTAAAIRFQKADDIAEKIEGVLARNPEKIVQIVAFDSSGEAILVLPDRGAQPMPELSALINTAINSRDVSIGSDGVDQARLVLGKDGTPAGGIAIDWSTAVVDDRIAYEAWVMRMQALVLFLVLSCGAAWLLRRQISAPLLRITAVVDRLARRDYQVEIPDDVRAAELAQLSRACSALRADLLEGTRLAEAAARLGEEREQRRVEQDRAVEKLRSALVRLADGDLTSPISKSEEDPFPADYEALRVSYNNALDRIASIIEEVSNIARSVRVESDDITNASRELSRRAETQAATLEQSSAALTELTQSVASTAQSAMQAQDASFRSREGAERGAEIVGEAVAAMQVIEQGSEKIGRIIGAIDDIAFQTNLLALNAGVEAARAGDSGRGFAVVASEVRLLAQRASESAREIKQLIMESSKQVEHGSELVRRAGESLQEIVGRASDASNLVKEIASAASEQARGLEEINSGVNHLDNVTQQNAAMAESTASAANTLQGSSQQLIKSLSGFRTDVSTRNTRPTNASREERVVAMSGRRA